MMSVIFKRSQESYHHGALNRHDSVMEISAFPVSFGATDLSHTYREVPGEVD